MPLAKLSAKFLLRYGWSLRFLMSIKSIALIRPLILLLKFSA